MRGTCFIWVSSWYMIGEWRAVLQTIGPKQDPLASITISCPSGRLSRPLALRPVLQSGMRVSPFDSSWTKGQNGRTVPYLQSRLPITYPGGSTLYFSSVSPPSPTIV
jgi:hypothetical protein